MAILGAHLCSQMACRRYKCIHNGIEATLFCSKGCRFYSLLGILEHVAPPLSKTSSSLSSVIIPQRLLAESVLAV